MTSEDSVRMAISAIVLDCINSSKDRFTVELATDDFMEVVGPMILRRIDRERDEVLQDAFERRWVTLAMATLREVDSMILDHTSSISKSVGGETLDQVLVVDVADGAEREGHVVNI